MARALMPRQPYSVAVPSTGGRLHPSFLRREGLVRMWSFPCRRDGKVEKSAQMEKRMRDDYRRRTGKEAESFCVL